MQKASEYVLLTFGKGVSNKYLSAVYLGGLLSHLHLRLAQHTPRLFALFLKPWLNSALCHCPGGVTFLFWLLSKA